MIGLQNRNTAETKENPEKLYNSKEEEINALKIFCFIY
jgi:hypothetical protein